jgi:hypothetical protein
VLRVALESDRSMRSGLSELLLTEAVNSRLRHSAAAGHPLERPGGAGIAGMRLAALSPPCPSIVDLLTRPSNERRTNDQDRASRLP